MTDRDVLAPGAVTRRAFCVHVSEAAGLAALASVLPGCGSPTSPSGSAPPLPALTGGVSGGVLTVTIDPASSVATVGGAALVQSSSAAFLVSRTAPDTFVALTAVCTHEGCTINAFRSPAYVCPCHGSEFSTSGSVLKGPASRVLRQFATQFTGTTLTITL